MTTISTLAKLISDSIYRIVLSSRFQDWFKKIKVSQGDYVVINNSVLFRKDLKTIKSTKYLGLKVLNPSPFEYEIYVLQTARKNNDFSYISGRSKELESIIANDFIESIENELNSLGRLIFILIGIIDRSEVFEQSIDHSLFTKITLNSSVEAPLLLQDHNIIIKEIVDAEILWELFVNACKDFPTIPSPLPDDLVGKFASSINELQKNSFAKLTIPSSTEYPRIGFLDQVIISLKQNFDNYLEAINACSNPSANRSEHYNILRISYTFADEIVRFLKLFNSISDVKPLLFWMTASEQFELSSALNQLPWEKLGTKPDLKNYVDCVKAARNKAFHNFLQFNQAIEVQMGELTIRPTKLRLFSEFTSKGNVFEYEDKELIEILTEFTRAGEKYVSFDFWKRNLIVMEKTICLFEAFSRSLKKLNNASEDSDIPGHK